MLILQLATSKIHFVGAVWRYGGSLNSGLYVLHDFKLMYGVKLGVVMCHVSTLHCHYQMMM